MTLYETELVAHIRESSPEVVALFENAYAKYAPVRFLDLGCSRCGALVNPINQLSHAGWHQDLSLQVFVMQMWAEDHVTTHILLS